MMRQYDNPADPIWINVAGAGAAGWLATRSRRKVGPVVRGLAVAMTAFHSWRLAQKVSYQGRPLVPGMGGLDASPLP